MQAIIRILKKAHKGRKEDDFMAALSRLAYVNVSGTSIPVYRSSVASSIHSGGNTAGGGQIGTIYNNEFYTVITNPGMYTHVYKILFRNSSGTVTEGYIETSKGETLGDYAWATGQAPYADYNSNGSTLVSASKQTVDGVSNCSVFTIYGSSRPYKTASGADMPTNLPVGTQLATNSSENGVNHPEYMVFKKKKLPGGNWENLISGSNHGFVNLGLNVGTMPSNRPIR